MTKREKDESIRMLVERMLSEVEVIGPPIPVERLARMRGATIRLVPYEGEMSGLIFPEDGQIIIGVNSLHAKTRQRFTIAHELGHLILHNPKKMLVDRDFRVLPRDENSSRAVDPLEIEANSFAAELLMPAFMLAHDLAGHSVDIEGDDLIHSLADRFKVSLQAMVFRLTNLGYLNQ